MIIRSFVKVAQQLVPKIERRGAEPLSCPSVGHAAPLPRSAFGSQHRWPARPATAFGIPDECTWVWPRSQHWRRPLGASGFWRALAGVSAQAVAGGRRRRFHSHHRCGGTLWGHLFAAALLRTTGLGAVAGWDAEAATSGGSTRLGSATATSLATEALATGADASTSVKAAGGSAISVMMSSATGALRTYRPQPALATAMKATAATAPQRKLLWRRGTAARDRLLDSCEAPANLDAFGACPLFRGARPILNYDLTGWKTPTPPSSPYRPDP